MIYVRLRKKNTLLPQKATIFIRYITEYLITLKISKIQFISPNFNRLDLKFDYIFKNSLFSIKIQRLFSKIFHRKLLTHKIIIKFRQSDFIIDGVSINVTEASPRSGGGNFGGQQQMPGPEPFIRQRQDRRSGGGRGSFGGGRQYSPKPVSAPYLEPGFIEYEHRMQQQGGQRPQFDYESGQPAMKREVFFAFSPFISQSVAPGY
jgi:hypothetical protein